MKAKEYLNQIEKLNILINNKLIEIEQWKSIALGTSVNTGSERVQSSGSQQKMADAVGRYIDLGKEINVYIDQLIEAKQDIINTIEQLPVTEYDLLHMVYVQFLTLDDVASKYKKSYSWATTIHGQALQSVQEILEERKKNVR